MKIGELAEEAGVTAKTVRFYESIGLMVEPNRSASGYRDYDHSALDRLRFIRDAQQTGLTLTEIHSLLDFKDAGIGACDHTKALIAKHLADLDQQIERLSQTRTALRRLYTQVAHLDPQHCTDPNRCQVIDTHRRLHGATTD